MTAVPDNLAAVGDGGATTSPDSPPADWPNRSASRLLRVNGRRWHVQEQGTGPTVLLVHGTGASTHSWHGLLPELARRYHVLAMDLPGHGFTDRRGDERLSLQRMTDELDSLLSQLGASPSYVVGHSAGTAIAAALALRGRLAPDLTVGLNAALLPFGGRLRPLIAPVTRLCGNIGLVSRLISSAAADRKSVQNMLESTGSVLDDTQLRWYQFLLCRPAHVSSLLSMMGNWDLGDLPAGLQRLGDTLLLVTAAGDRAVPPAQADVIRRSAPSVRHRALESGGHLVHEEDPAGVAALLDSEFREAAARRASHRGEA